MQSIGEMLSAKVTPYHAWKDLPTFEKKVNGNLEKQKESIKKISECLNHEPKTLIQISEITKLSYSTVKKYISMIGVARGKYTKTRWVARWVAK